MKKMPTKEEWKEIKKNQIKEIKDRCVFETKKYIISKGKDKSAETKKILNYEIYYLQKGKICFGETYQRWSPYICGLEFAKDVAENFDYWEKQRNFKGNKKIK
jgi:hypothetical protein